MMDDGWFQVKLAALYRYEMRSRVNQVQPYEVIPVM
jgi:hypothetical protein